MADSLVTRLSLRVFVVWIGFALGCAGPPPAAPPLQPSLTRGPEATSPAVQPLPSPSPSPSPSPLPLATLRLAQPPAALGAWQIDVAERNGFIRQQGLALERSTEEGEKAADALNAGTRDVALVAVESVVRASRAGQNLVMVGGAVNRAAFSLVVGRDIQELANLRGQPVGIRDPKDATAALLGRMLKARGLSPADVRLVSFADPALRAAAIANGTVAGSLLDPAQTTRMQGGGFKVLGNAFDTVRDFQAEALAVRKDWARQNEDRLVRFLRAIVEADRWIHAPEHRQEAIEVLAGTLRLTTLDAARVYEQYVEKVPAIPRGAEVEQPGVRTVVELLAEVNALRPPLPDPATLTDTTYVQRAALSAPAR
ncbi:MAG TPA: ABC transporter substrate-binding protein [Chloroflexota bacterium]|nr:ABC transporter substrate-binding protein [Chloroflexota bacterium]